MQRTTILNFRHKSASRYCTEIKNPGTRNVELRKPETREENRISVISYNLNCIRCMQIASLNKKKIAKRK
jgi:hypothetical protein